MMKRILMLVILVLATTMAQAQKSVAKSTAAVLQIDAIGVDFTPTQLGDITRLELEKLNKYQVVDKYDMRYLLKQKEINIEGCFGKLCMVEVGKAIDADMMMTGSVERIGKMILVSLKLIDVASGTMTHTEVGEYINNEMEIRKMLNLTMAKLFDQEVDEDVMTKLTNPNDYTHAMNTASDRLNLNGPRMGVVVLTGPLADAFQAPRDQGGFETGALLTQFGYQFEVNYINEGNFQALFEFIPMVTGLDQGLFIPSLTFMNGLRSSKSGIEVAFGPTFSFVPMSEGYFDEMGNWNLRKAWRAAHGSEPNPFPIHTRPDHRGIVETLTGFVIAAGKTFKSGRLNIPVNAFFTPGKNGAHRFGISVGFNGKGRKKANML